MAPSRPASPPVGEPAIPGLCAWTYREAMGYYSSPTSNGREASLNMRTADGAIVTLVDSQVDGTVDRTNPPVQVPTGKTVDNLCGALFRSHQQELWARYTALLEHFQPPSPKEALPRPFPLINLKVASVQSGSTQDGGESFVIEFHKPQSAEALLDPLIPATGTLIIRGTRFVDGSVNLLIQDTDYSGHRYNAVIIKESKAPTEVTWVKKLKELISTIKP